MKVVMRRAVAVIVLALMWPGLLQSCKSPAKVDDEVDDEVDDVQFCGKTWSAETEKIFCDDESVSDRT